MHLSDADQATLDGLLDEIAQLRQAMTAVPLIEQAKGVLMHRYDIDADMAFQLLNRWSLAMGTRVSVVAEVLLELAEVREVSPPHPDLVAALASQLGGSWRL